MVWQACKVANDACVERVPVIDWKICVKVIAEDCFDKAVKRID